MDPRGAEARARDPDRRIDRWSDPRGRAEPVFLRLGMPLDVANLTTLGGDVALALDARALRAGAFQLNQGWWTAHRHHAPRGKVLDGRAMDDAALFAHLKALDRARRRMFGLNGPLARARTSCCMMSNEILADSPVSLAESLRVVFAPTGLPAAEVAKLRALVAKRYPLARVEEYASES